MRCRNRQCKTDNGKRSKLPKGALPAVCSDACRDAVIREAIAQSNKAAERAIAKAKNTKAQEEKAKRAEFRRKKQEFVANDISHQFELTKKAAQRLANLLDRDLECISCGCGRSVQFCGGHFRTVGAHRELALDLRNIHGQCNRNCNMGLSGNIAGTKRTRGFRAGLLERYGQAFVEFLESAHPTKRPTAAELAETRREFRAEIRRLEKGLPPSRDWRALPIQEQRLSGRALPAEQEKAA